MNTANLQLEGLYLALAAINRALIKNGNLTPDELSARKAASSKASGLLYL